MDAAVREVNRLLGEVQEEEGVIPEEATRPETAAYHALLKVDRRCVLHVSHISLHIKARCAAPNKPRADCCIWLVERCVA